MYATISKKQAGVIFGAWKRGEIEASKEEIDMMYFRFVGESAPTTDAAAIDCCDRLKAVVDSIFAHDGKASEAFRNFIDCYKMKFADTMFAL